MHRTISAAALCLILTMALTAVACAAEAPVPVKTQVPVEIPIPGTGIMEAILAPAAAEARRGMEKLQAGDYAAALEYYQQAKELHGSPSAVLESSIGLTYGRLGRYGLSIEHHSIAIELRDLGPIRMNRASSYQRNGQCADAIEDSRVALELEPVVKAGHHTHAEAHAVSALCYMGMGRDREAIEHMDAALVLGREHGYSDNAIGYFEEERELASQRLDTPTP